MGSGEVTKVFERLREVLASHGVPFDLASTPQATMTRVGHELRLPPDFVETYVASGPANGSYVPWVVEQLTVYSFAELLVAQEGYAWSGPDRRKLSGWLSDWVVVASVFGDPFFVDVGGEGCPVLFARHGAGDWKPIRVAQNLAAFVDGLSELEIVLLGDFRGNAFDASGLREDFKTAVRTRLASTLDGSELENFIGALE